MRNNLFHDVEPEINLESCVIRSSDSAKGRTRWLEPGRAAVRHLHYGRVILDAADAPVRFATGDHETGLICLKGAANLRVAGESFEVTPYDAVYAPRGSQIDVAPGTEGCDLAELSAPVEGSYPVRLVRFADVLRDPGLHFRTGGPGSERVINILLGKNIEAGRIVAGITFSEPGNWTSWPPHEHAEMLEEAYLYFDMPAPGWGVQFVYTDTRDPELMTAVREGDCVVMPKGYHPNVAAPGSRINFLWMMAAHREKDDRQFGVVNVQPEYASGKSGLEVGRADGK
jgi:5-deoxy-glucuronate isomerase